MRFDDYWITDKALDFAAKEQGTDKEELISGLSIMAPAILAQFNMPELQEQVSAAISSYLKNPKNIEIKAAPSAPTPIMTFVALASNPASLIEALNVSISANK
ncbi:MAG: hypothetical protein L3J32_08715 [Rhizobiaceae bacterium]|nr:hypothetical protein [Rhizobiaceae bacterium]